MDHRKNRGKPGSDTIFQLEPCSVLCLMKNKFIKPIEGVEDNGKPDESVVNAVWSGGGIVVCMYTKTDGKVEYHLCGTYEEIERDYRGLKSGDAKQIKWYSGFALVVDAK